MIVGNLVLVFALVSIAGKRDSFLCLADAAFWAAALAIVLARYVDVRYLGGDTVTGERATMAHWKRHALILAAVALVSWGVAHVVAWVR